MLRSSAEQGSRTHYSSKQMHVPCSECAGGHVPSASVWALTLSWHQRKRGQEGLFPALEQGPDARVRGLHKATQRGRGGLDLLMKARRRQVLGLESVGRRKGPPAEKN